jgi:8-amino-7-oxononanoate synthase
MMDWDSWVSAKLAALAVSKRQRSLRPLGPIEGSAVSVTVRPRVLGQMLADEPSTGEVAPPSADAAATALTVFASNDYLGLSDHSVVRTAASRAAASYGCGPRASALVCGYTEEHRALETALAKLKGSEEALLFPTGYAANLAVLTALADAPDCAIFSDALNHASIIDGARLASRGAHTSLTQVSHTSLAHKSRTQVSHHRLPICHTPPFEFITRVLSASRGAGASLVIYRHNDMGHLKECLLASRAPRKLIVSDSLFSMDGDCAHVRELSQLAKTHGALTVLDEAHATLVFGSRGGGLAEGLEIDMHVGTLSKAFGAHGGFVACTAKWKALLLSRARTAIYSTALPMPVVVAAATALRLATDRVRARLWANVAAFGAATGIKPTSPIVPIVVGSEANALAMSAALLRDGFLVPAIRPPTVPLGTARLRIALSAAHTLEQIHALAAALKRCGALETVRRATEKKKVKKRADGSTWQPMTRL